MTGYHGMTQTRTQKVTLDLVWCEDIEGEHEGHIWHWSNELSDEPGQPRWLYLWCPGKKANP
jgi:hypothetical protein